MRRPQPRKLFAWSRMRKTNINRQYRKTTKLCQIPRLKHCEDNCRSHERKSTGVKLCHTALEKSWNHNREQFKWRRSIDTNKHISNTNTQNNNENTHKEQNTIVESENYIYIYWNRYRCTKEIKFKSMISFSFTVFSFFRFSPLFIYLSFCLISWIRSKR